MMTRRKPFTLVHNSLSDDTIEALHELLEGATRGEVIGIAFAAMYRNRRYLVDTAGECHRNPTFARGMVAELHDELGRRARGEGSA